MGAKGPKVAFRPVFGRAAGPPRVTRGSPSRVTCASPRARSRADPSLSPAKGRLLPTATPTATPTAPAVRVPAPARPGSPEVTVTDPALVRRAVKAAALGNAMEWFDFGVYSYIAVTL